MQEIVGLGQRLKMAREALGYAQKGVAEAAGGKLRSWQDYEAGNKVPGSRVIAGLARLGVNANWVLTGEGRMLVDNEAVIRSPETTTTDEYAYIPLYDACAAAGHGAIVDTAQVIDSFAFKREWIHNELHVNPADLYLIQVQGESMEPTLRPGDVILVNHSDSGASREGIYVLRMDDALLVKRIQRLPGGIIRVSSDNPAYEPFQLTRADMGNGLALIGRVVWAGRRM